SVALEMHRQSRYLGSATVAPAAATGRPGVWGRPPPAGRTRVSEPARHYIRPPSVQAGLEAPATMIAAFVVLNAVLIMVAYMTLLERKFAARMQSRIGPYYVGRPHGWLQPVADAIKLLLKEDIVPTASDRWVYNLAPIVFLVPCLLIFATIPFAPELGVADLNIGVLFFLAVSALEIVGLFMGGWG